MKTHYKLLILFFLISGFYLSSCVFGGEGSGDSLILGASEGNADDRDTRRRASRDTRSSGKCEDVEDCDEICEEVYDADGEDENEGKINKCLELNYSAVEEIEKIVEILGESKPDYVALSNIELKHFKRFLSVSVSPWIELVKDLHHEGSKTVLRWIAVEPNVAGEIIAAHDDYAHDLYDGVYFMLKDIGKSNLNTCERICDGASDVAIGAGRSFWEIVNREDNDNAKRIVCELIVDINCNTDTLKAACNTADNAGDIYDRCKEFLCEEDTDAELRKSRKCPPPPSS